LLGISTVWRSKVLRDGKTLIKEILDLELDGLELEYRITKKMLGEMMPTLYENKTKIFSVHNFFPVPAGVPDGKGNGDLFLLSSEDRDERKKAVKHTINTIQMASDLGAQVVVLHLGRVQMASIKYELYEFYDNKMIGSKEYVAAMKRFKSIRAEAKLKSFDPLLLSVEELLSAADRYGIDLGIENRYYFREFPDFEEIGYIFNKFKGGRLGYWHDTGHAQVNQSLGIIGAEMFLKEYGECLLGVHLHDAKGYSDHNAPGMGDIDFSVIAKYLKPETIKIIEIHPRVTRDELFNGINLLREKGIT